MNSAHQSQSGAGARGQRSQRTQTWQGKTTAGCSDRQPRPPDPGALVLVFDDAGPDPRFRLTPLGGGRYGLSLHDRNRWDPLPYEGTLAEMVEVMNNDLAVWATDCPELPS